LPIADCRLPIADCRLPIADCRSPIVDFRLSISDCRFPIVGDHSAPPIRVNLCAFVVSVFWILNCIFHSFSGNLVEMTTKAAISLSVA
jgi:hypothetical protein